MATQFQTESQDISTVDDTIEELPIGKKKRKAQKHRNEVVETDSVGFSNPTAQDSNSFDDELIQRSNLEPKNLKGNELVIESSNAMNGEDTEQPIKKETDLESETKSGKQKKKKDRKKNFDLDFDVEEELNRVEKDETEIVSKPQNIQNSKMNKEQEVPIETETAGDQLILEEGAEDINKGQKKRDKKKQKKLQDKLEEVNVENEPVGDESVEDNTQEPAAAESSSSKKKGKKEKAAKGPSSAVKEKLRKALKDQQEAEKLKQEEEERKAREFEMKEQERLEKLEKERLRKEKKKAQKKERIAGQKLAGTYVNKEQKEKMKERQEKLVTMQQAYGVVAGTTAEEGGASRVKYGERKRNRNKETKDQELNGNSDQMKDESVDQSQAEEITTETTALEDDDNTGVTKSKQDVVVVVDNWEDVELSSDASHSDSETSDESATENNTELDKQNIETKTKVKSEPNATTTTKQNSNEVPKSDVNAKNTENKDINGTKTKDSSSSSSDSDSELSGYDIAKERIRKRKEKALTSRSKDKLRSPILCVLGHVDTGKTKILDKIRHTSVQDGEAGGITQQIGASFVPADVIKTQTSCVKEFAQKTEILIPGVLIIDTPGHESFRNLRSRGSSLCDIAILVVDIMHGLEPQTIESINLLKKKKCKFIIALNKIDRLYDWRRNPHSSVKENLKKQKRNTTDEFNERFKAIRLQLNEQALNVALFWEKVNFEEYTPIVPTSAITGDGMGDLMAMMVLMSQKYLINQLMWSSVLEATVMEVKVTTGYGHTVDVILKNGVVKEGDTLVLFGTEGPIVTQTRAILTPQPLKEMRVKGDFIYHQIMDNSQGIKIAGKDLEFAIAGSPVLIPAKPDETPVLVDDIKSEMEAALKSFKLKDKGVYVQASTLGALEALLEFLNTSKIPYSGINIGPVHRKDVIKCSAMLQHDAQFAVILAFDVRIEKEAQDNADQLGIQIFKADIIYHLFDEFIAHRKEYAQRMKEEHKHLAVYPVKLSIVPNCVFNSRDPIVMGVKVEEGILKTGTPIYVPDKEVDLGIITSIEMNHKSVDKARKGMEVCIKIESPPGDAPKMFERHFGFSDELISKISRESIDTMKKYFKTELIKEDWELIIELKKTFGIY